MTDVSPPPRTVLPSIDRLMRSAALASYTADFGRDLVVECARTEIAELRRRLSEGDDVSTEASEAGLAARIGARLQAAARPSLVPVFNLTGTVLHTNLGRAALPSQALDAVVAVSSGASNLEYDLELGRRGDRDSHLEAILCRLTGAEAATVVNNNAAAVLLVLNSLALRKEVPVSRGELIEIGGAFRMPDIMARAGCKLHEVGTTNRTHLRDFESAIGKKTALLMTVHTSNYEVQGFTAAVPEAELATLAHRHELPFVVDLGSGTLVDLAKYGLPHERTPAEAIADGADIVTFSGDKLLGGPQAGIIVGRRDLVEKLRRNPLKRALRLDKMTIAALSAVLQLYLDPDRLTANLPTLRALARPLDEITALAERLAPVMQASLADSAEVACESCHSQIGSGALPVDLLPSMGLIVRPVAGRGRGAFLKRVAAAFRALPRPVIGRIQNDSFQLDLRCLEDEPGFVDQLSALATALRPAR
jgi:L-seryl-tRNA(Ser) seleniumtransferase